MKKLKSIFALILVVMFSSCFLVACDEDDDDSSNGSGTFEEQVIKSRFDEAYQMILESEKYIQTFQYSASENDDDSYHATKVITNISNNVTKIYIENSNDDSDMYMNLSENDTTVTSKVYDINNKTYSSNTIGKDQIILSGGLELMYTQIKRNMYGGADINYNLFFEVMTEQLNGIGVYSTKTEEGYEFLTYKITAESEEYEYTVSIYNDKVVSFREYKTDLDDESYELRVTNFAYTGNDLIINVDVSDFIEEQQ